MTNKEILSIAMRQSAIDNGCSSDDFLKHESIVVESRENENARVYLTLPLYCNLVSYGNNIVASGNPEIFETMRTYINKYPIESCFETPNLFVLDEALRQKGHAIRHMAEYFLPDVDILKPLPCAYELKVLSPADFADLYLPQWGNALLEKRKHLDMLAVGAYHNGELIGLAGCSADCDTMWQIGIDVLPEYRKQGIASALTSHLAVEILARGKVPFYCCAWSNVGSARNAIKSGFRPAWVEMTAKPIDAI